MSRVLLTETIHFEAVEDTYAAAETMVVRIREELSRSSYAAIRTFTCECHQGVLQIKGRSPSFYLKQMAVSLVLHALQNHGARNVDIDVNGISVRGHLPCNSLN